MKNTPELTILYQKYLNNSCSAEELKELLSNFETELPSAHLREMIISELESDGQPYLNLPQVNSILIKLDEKILSPKVKKFKITTYKYWSAAAILVVLSVTLYFANVRHAMFGTRYSEYKNDVDPGSDKAYLTLSDGRRILLTDSLSGSISSELGVQVKITNRGELRYLITEPNDRAASGYHTITTPNGGKFEVVLSDGTVVFLNSSSSVRFPVSFGRLSERRVELVGEGYFEVAHDKSKPFYVQSGKQLVRVLGTHFNLNAYPEEHSVKTTLFQGLVRVSEPNVENVILRPGEQSSIADGQLLVNLADTTEVLDWKRGEINLKEENFRATMRKVARWYDVEVVFASDAPDDLRLGGLVSREKSLVTILKVMELTGKVHFKVEGRRVTVMR